MAVWLYCYMAIWLCGYMAVWLYDNMIQVDEFVQISWRRTPINALAPFASRYDQRTTTFSPEGRLMQVTGHSLILASCHHFQSILVSSIIVGSREDIYFCREGITFNLNPKVAQRLRFVSYLCLSPSVRWESTSFM